MRSLGWAPLARLFAFSCGLGLLGPVGCGEDSVAPVTPFPQLLTIVGGQHLVGVVGSRSSEPIAVRVSSNEGIPFQGTQVVFAITNGDAAVVEDVVTTDTNGVAFTFVQFGNTAGIVEATATVHGLAGSPAHFDLMSIAADASRLLPISGGGQTGTVASTLAASLVVKVVDAFDNPVAGVTISFVPDEQSGTADPAQVTVAEDGLASTAWTLGTSAGTQRMLSQAPGVGGFPVLFTASASADVAATVTAVGGNNQGGAVGQPLTEDLVARVDDQYGNPVAGETVHFEVTTGNGTVLPADVETNAEGLAATTLTLGAAGDHAVRATVGTLAPATFVSRSFPPTMLNPPQKTLTSIVLNWSGIPGTGFERYEVRRSVVSPVTQADELVASISDPGAMSHSDDTVQIGTRYYYRVYVYYEGGFSLSSNEETTKAGVSIALPGNGWDLALDSATEKLYVSIPTLNEVAVISTATFEIIDDIIVGSRPYGMDLSLDSKYLFVALNGAGSVAVVDLTAGSVSQILIGNELGDDRAYDVLNPKPDVLVVTSSPSSSGFAYVVRVNLDFTGGHSAERIASGRIIRATPTLGMGPNGDFVYIGEGFSPNSLYKIDMNTPGNPIVLEDDHGSVSGTTQFDVSPDGTRIYLWSGQILRSASFNTEGYIAAGIPLVNLDGSRCFVGKSNEIEVFNTNTFLQTAGTPIPVAADKMLLMNDETALLVLSDDLIYGIPVPLE